MKKLIENYVFKPIQNTIELDGFIKSNQLLLITNTTQNKSIYIFNNAESGLNNISYDFELIKTIIKLNYDCSDMNTSDNLQIFIEEDSTTIVEHSDTFTDSSNNLKVSSKKSIFDSSFQYDLEDEKWETLERISETPTFYKKDASSPLFVQSIKLVSQSNIVNVTTQGVHNLKNGNYIIIEDSISDLCNGVFIITNVIDTVTIQFNLVSNSAITKDVAMSKTKLFTASKYNNSNLDISSIETDEAENSTLTVKTASPINLSKNTALLISSCFNEVQIQVEGQEQPNYDCTLTDLGTVTVLTATGETNRKYLSAYYPYRVEPLDEDTLYFSSTDATVASNIITFKFPHGLVDNMPYFYLPGIGNTPINLIGTTPLLYVRVTSTTACYFTATKGSTTKIAITTPGSNGGLTRQMLVKAFTLNVAQVSGVNYAKFLETPNFSVGDYVSTEFYGGVGTAVIGATPNIMSQQQQYGSQANKVTSVSGNNIVFNNNTTNNTSTAANNTVMAIRINKNSKPSYYLPNHGLNADDYIYVKTNITTDVTTTLGMPFRNSKVYKVLEIIDDNRFSITEVATIPSLRTGAIVVTNSLPGTYTIYKINFNFINSSVLPNTFKYISQTLIPTGSSIVYNNNTKYIYNFIKNNTNYLKMMNTSGTGLNSFTFTELNRVYTSSINHNLETGDTLYSNIRDFENSTFLKYVRKISETKISLHLSMNDALNNLNPIASWIVNATPTYFESGTTGTTVTLYGFIDEYKLSISDQGLNEFSSTQAVNAQFLVENVENETTFKIKTNTKFNSRKLQFDVRKSLNLLNNSFNIESHNMITGAPIIFKLKSGSSISNLVENTKYFAIVLNDYSFKIATSYENALNNIFVEFEESVDGLYELFFVSSIIEYKPLNTVTVNGLEIKTTSGTFKSQFSIGDKFKIVTNKRTASPSILSSDFTTGLITIGSVSFESVGIYSLKIITTSTAVETDNIYYIKVENVSQTQFKLYDSVFNIVNNLESYSFSENFTGNVVITLNEASFVDLGQIKNIKDNDVMFCTKGGSYNDVSYMLSTNITFKGNSQTLFRPYDGGAELSLGKSSNGSLVRQTKKYFKCENDKSLTLTAGINFSGSYDIDDFTKTTSTHAKITTRYPHRLSVGLVIKTAGAEIDSQIWNKEFTVSSIIDDYSFLVSLSELNINANAVGNLKFNVKSWNGSSILVGSFDDQNGTYVEYNGSELSVCLRTANNSLSGLCSINNGTSELNGSSSKFSTQLKQNDKIVINGSVYSISKVINDNKVLISPKYIGSSINNVVIMKINEIKIPRTQWNLDKCDGFGKSKFVLNTSKFQTLVFDYTLGSNFLIKVGFKDLKGKVFFAHQFNSNEFTKPMFISNSLPVRYEIKNSSTFNYSPKLIQNYTSVSIDENFQRKYKEFSKILAVDSALYLTLNSSFSNGVYGLTGSNELTNRSSLEITKLLIVDEPISGRTSLPYNISVYTDVLPTTENFSKIDVQGSSARFIQSLVLPSSGKMEFEHLTYSAFKEVNVSGIEIFNSILSGDLTFPNGYNVVCVSNPGAYKVKITWREYF